jgi:ubiquinone biosynthesis protein
VSGVVDVPPASGGSHLARYRQIAAVLARHGLGYATDALGLGRFLPLQIGFLGHARREEPYTEAEHMRLALEDLGATFIKLGQILSTRSDIVPEPYVSELAKLQDGVPPVPTEAIEEVVVAELGQPIDALFAAFDPTPLAAASIGQAHAARMADGTEVVVKIRRPGVVAQVNEDLEILMNLARRANGHARWAEQFDFVGLAQEFAETLRAELDYVREAENAARFAQLLADDAGVRIPRIFADRSTSRVLTLERFGGLKASDVAGLDAAGIDRKALAERLAGLNLTMVFEHGFFHADPHPGNFFIEPSGRIGLIDFGMVGEVSPTLRQQLAAFFIAVDGKDSERLVDVLLEVCTSRGHVDRVSLQRDFERIMDVFYREQLGRLGVGSLLNDVMSTVRKYRLRLPNSLALLFKTWIMIEGTVAILDPTANMAAFFTPYVRKLITQQYSPTAIAARMRAFSLDLADVSATLPRRLNRILSDLENGNLTVETRATGYEPVLERLETLTNRLTFATVGGAFIVALPVLMVVYRPRGWKQWSGPAFALGVTVAASTALFLAGTIARRRRS